MAEIPTFVTHLECSLTGERYAADALHGLSHAGKPLVVRYDLEALAGALDKETVALVTARLRAVLQRDVDVQLEVDPKLVGGLVVRVGDTVYDGSVANQLARLRDDMIAKTNQRIRIELERFAKTD